MLRNLCYHQLRRRMMSTNNIGQTEIKEISKVGNDGKTTYLKETITTLKNSWSHTSPLKKKIVYGYLLGSIVDNGYGSYQSGRNALEEFRNDPTKYPDRRVKTDWQAAYYGCSSEICSRFFESLVWPISIASRVMPSMIIWLNPPKSSEPTI